MNIAKFLKTRILKNIVSSLLITNINHCVDNYNKNNQNLLVTIKNFPKIFHFSEIFNICQFHILFPVKMYCKRIAKGLFYTKFFFKNIILEYKSQQKPPKISKKESFATIANAFQLIATFAKFSLLDIFRGSGNSSVQSETLFLNFFFEPQFQLRLNLMFGSLRTFYLTRVPMKIRKRHYAMHCSFPHIYWRKARQVIRERKRKPFVMNKMKMSGEDLKI